MARIPAGMRKKSNNSYEYRFYVDGVRYSVCGATPKECKAKETEKRAQIAAGTLKKGKSLNVSEYMERWLESREQVISSATMRTYKKLNNRMMRQAIDKAGHTFGKQKLEAVETEHVRQLQKALSKDGLSTRTVNDSLSLLKHAFESAVNERIITWNPAKGVERLKRTEEPARDTIHRALTRDEVKTFLAAAEESWYYNLFVFLLHTGLRIGEASALTVLDVTQDRINVFKTVTREQLGYFVREQTKTEAGRRTIDTRPEAWEAFQEQRRINEMLQGVIAVNKPVFTLPKGGIIRPDRVNDEIKRICTATGIEYFTCHAFRATFASRCIAAGVPVKILMEILGHVDVQMTLGLYGHGEDEQRRAQMMAVNM